MQELQIRPATEDDLPALEPIYTAPVNTLHIGFESVPADEFPGLADDVGLLEGLRAALLNNTIVGAFQLKRFRFRMTHVAELTSVAIRPDHHGKGIGREMIRRTLDELRDSGVRRVQLSASADNTGGLAFWESLGFKREGVYRGYFRRADETADTDEIAMALLFDGDL